MAKKEKAIPVSTEPLTCTGCGEIIEVNTAYGLDEKKQPFHIHCLLTEGVDDESEDSAAPSLDVPPMPETPAPAASSEPAQDVQTTEPTPAAPVVADPAAPSFPTFEGAQVVQVLEEDVNGQWHLCKMSDGTQKHVPVELFTPSNG